MPFYTYRHNTGASGQVGCFLEAAESKGNSSGKLCKLARLLLQVVTVELGRLAALTTGNRLLLYESETLKIGQGDKKKQKKKKKKKKKNILFNAGCSTRAGRVHSTHSMGRN